MGKGEQNGEGKIFTATFEKYGFASNLAMKYGSFPIISPVKHEGI